MDFDDSPQEAEFRARFRAWLVDHNPGLPASSTDDEYWAKQAEWHCALFDGGFFALTWPKAYGGQELPPVYEVIVANSEDPHRKTEMLGKIADIHERRLANFDAAFDAYSRALRIDPGNPDVIAHLDRLSEVTGRWADLATAYEAEVERVMESRLQVEMLLRIGRIYEE